ncbi:MAG: dockerin type I domain-containing protein, partial [Pirellulaceae bacterium]
IEFEEQNESSGGGSGDESDSVGSDFASAVPLTPIVGTTLRYTAVGAINDPSIPTIYRLEPSLGEAEDLEHLNVALLSTGPGRLIAEVQIFDEDGDEVETQVIHHGEGSVVVQARNVRNDETHYVRVRSANTSPDYQVGGFEIVMDYGPEVRESREIADLRISEFTPIIQQSFSVASSRFVHLHFDSDFRDGPGSRVWATLSNSLGQQVAQTTLQGGESRSMPVVFLSSGEYSIQVTTGAPGETIVGETRVNVFVDEISIDVGPGVSNPTGEPYLWCEDPNANPDYCYEYTPIDVPEPTAPGPDTIPDLSDPEWWVYYGFRCDDYTGTDLETVQEEDPLWWDFYVEVCQATTPPTTPSNPPTTPTDPPTTPTNPPTTPTNPPTTPTNPPTTPTNPPTAPIPPPPGTQLSPWQNRLDKYDVSGDQQVTPLDLLMVLNFLGGHRGETINVTGEVSDGYTDVNGDFIVSPSDALMVINALALRRVDAQGEVASVFLTDLVHEQTDWTLVDPEDIPSLF